MGTRSGHAREYSLYLMKVTPTLLTPHLLSLKNRWIAHRGLPRKQLLSLSITTAMMVGLYLCSMSMFQEIIRASPNAHLMCVPIMGALAMAMFIMVLLSSSASAVSALYVSKDMDFLLSSPVSKRTLLVGKVCEITLSTCWMLVVFCIPLYLSYGRFFAASPLYYVLAPIVIVLFLAPAVLLGTTAAILFSSLLPAKGGRHAFALLFAVSIGLFFAILNHGAKMALPSTVSGVSAMRALTEGGPSYTRPGYWIARSIDGLTRGEIWLAMVAIVCALALIAISWLIASFLFQRLFLRAYTKLQASSSPLQIDSRFGRAIARVLFAATRRRTRALITKEVYAFSRELTQTFQLAMLLTICALYSYNFSQLSPPTKVGVEILQIWDVFMAISNILLGLMVILSISSRFVFPCVSLEGASLWILQSAPVSTRDILRAKYTSWFTPISVLVCVIFSAGGCAIGVEPRILLASMLSGVIISHGLVTLGLGFGARFARFDWEHSGQLATNSGNFAYILTGILFLVVNMIPVTAMFGAYYLLPGVFRDNLAALILLTSGLVVLSTINITVGRISISIGARALQRCLS
jgi:ABC-2 type transport system permease protein